MNTLETPTVPTPANMAENTPSLNRGDMLQEADESNTYDRPVLGDIANREEYQQNQEELAHQASDPARLDRDAALGKATLSRDMEDDKVRDELFSGFAIHDSTQPEATIDDDHDELPDDLKDELGEPDNDEVHEQ